MPLTLTDKAVEQIQKVMQEQNISSDDNMLEVGVSGSACSGLNYSLGFTKRSEVDILNSTAFNFNGLKAVVSNKLLGALDGVTVDYYEGLDQSGFTFTNNSANIGCCGGGCS